MKNDKKMIKCNKVIKTITNFFGDEENQYCVKEKNHKYGCRFKEDYSVFGKYKKFTETKQYRMAYQCAGETNENSPILNRSNRFSPQLIGGEKYAEVLSDEEKIILKEQSIYKVGVRKDEISTFEQCKKVEVDLYNDLLSCYNDNDLDCPLFGQAITWEQFIDTDRTAGLSIQGCHLDPLSEDEVQHVVGNVKWGHRNCNQIQGDRSLDTLVDDLKVMVSHLEKIKNTDIRKNKTIISLKKL